MRILMLGNSLTTANGLPDALARRLDAQVVVHARGGARLAEHLNPATKLGAKTAAAFEAGGWDYVVLQEMSNGPVRYRGRFLEAVSRLCGQARDGGAQPVVYATWAYAPDCPKLQKLGLTHGQMHDQMHGAFVKAAGDGRALLADVGTAFFEHPQKEMLYAADGVHPSAMGTELALDSLAGALVRAASGVPDAPPAGTAVATPYHVYLLLCEDGTYYTGITTDVQRRFQEHRERGPKSARYTRSHPVVEVAASWELPDRSQASKAEAFIKRLTHSEKAQLAAAPDLFRVIYPHLA